MEKTIKNMLIKLEFEISFKNKKTHHNKDYDARRKEERLNLKKPCIVCGGKIKEKYRRKLCSDKCQVAYDRTRKHIKQ